MKKLLNFLFVVSVLIVGISFGIMLAFKAGTEMSTSLKHSDLVAFHGNTESSIYLPAVNQQGSGVVTKLYVRTVNGTGRTLVDINDIIFWGDTQESIQTAKSVASELTGIGLNDVDITYSIQSEASIIEGQSAGAALTIATIAALENRTLPPDVVMTGTVDRNGRIGYVGGIIEKANASKQAGAKIFLVPEGQAFIRQTNPEKVCKEIAKFIWCSVKFNENLTKVEDVVGITIKEVATIEEAMEYFDLKGKVNV